MGKHTKLELTWIGKDDRPRLEPRILKYERLRGSAQLQHDDIQQEIVKKVEEKHFDFCLAGIMRQPMLCRLHTLLSRGF